MSGQGRGWRAGCNAGRRAGQGVRGGVRAGVHLPLLIEMSTIEIVVMKKHYDANILPTIPCNFIFGTL
jgi:hypothetical protein